MFMQFFFDQLSLSAYVWIMHHYNRKIFDHFYLELLRYIVIPKYKLNVELGNPLER